MTDIDNFGTSWQGLTHGQVEDAIKAKVTQLDSTKLDDSSDVIQQLASAASSAYHKEPTGIPKQDLTQSVQDSLELADSSLQPSDKTQLQNAINSLQNALNALIGSGNVQGAIDTFNEVVAFLNGIDTDDPTLFNQLKSLSDSITALQNTLSQKANDNAVVKSISVNGTAQTKDGQGNVNIQVQAGDQVSVTTNNDGTFTIHAGSNDYTVNLNHTHENMAKLIVCEESDLPSTLDNDTIYAITDSGETEIEKLIIRGMEFAGGVPDTGMPQVKEPSPARPLNLGTNDGSGVTALVDVKARNLNYNGSTDGLTVSVGQNSGLLLSYDQTVDATSITIPQLAAETGCQITVKYTGSGALDDGALVFSHDNAVLASVVVVVVVVTPIPLSAIQLTGLQWLQTDYCPGPATEFELEMMLTDCTNNNNNNNKCLLSSTMNTVANTANIFRLYILSDGIYFANEESITYSGSGGGKQLVSQNGAVNQKGTFIYSIVSASVGRMELGSASHATSTKTTPMENPLMIGRGRTTNSAADDIFDYYKLTIYRLTITEGGTTVRNYVPATLDGVPGLHDTVTGAFISSETSTPVVAIE